ncbi:chemotaxis protein CheW [Chromatiaceae bacterium AAb-1]|nr:chemotaxis protein CheW [Chromatiaceae bacterium AAb-1]
MSNLLASQKVMRNYLTALLTEDEPAERVLTDESKKRELNRLLSQASVAEQPVAVTEVKAPVSKVVESAEPVAVPVAVTPPAVVPEVVKQAPVTQVKPELKDYRKGRFQALFFSVAGLTIAVPLKQLGGIHQIQDTSTLFGKPDWFKGVMLYRDQKINVVDSARWVMPEKYNPQLAENLNYQYVIMLGTSNWGLSCETLINTVALEQDEVQWRETEGKRPWMAGLIKKHMCVLVDVDAMIDLLNRGLDISR